MNRTERGVTENSFASDADASRWNVRILCSPVDVVLCPALIELSRQIVTILTMNDNTENSAKFSGHPQQALSSNLNLHILLRSSRLFLPLNKLESISEDGNGRELADTLSFSLESLELKPLTDNRLERPPLFDKHQIYPEPFVAMRHAPNETDLQYVLDVHACAVQAVTFYSITQSNNPHTWSSRVSVGVFHSGTTGEGGASGCTVASRRNMTPEHQNPAQYWNQSNCCEKKGYVCIFVLVVC
ncbi:unnamed protein product [Echinostoma caproni]|uniref:Peptidase_M14 domain-containing protein n=1 Tax=Echinostoma caproni TaxID=27848 RepID=A0A183BBM4_9TREM|nr:unnamed protein product [Echinostoma caproni]